MTLSTAAGDLGQWVLLSYRLPREPSTPRITLWRRLKRWGVVQVGDGLVGLPADARTREQLEWAAEEVLDAGGTAVVWLARPTSAAHERMMAGVMTAARAVEYDDLAAAAAHALTRSAPEQARTLRRLRSRWREITRRDFFPSEQREAAAVALSALTSVPAFDGIGIRPAAPTARSAMGSNSGSDGGQRS